MAQPQASNAPDAATPLDTAPHILIVDDDTRIRQLLTQYLSQNGYRVTAAQDADDARRKMDGLEFDMLVLDVMMPGENGLSLARDLRQRDRDVPILMLTARSETEQRIDGLDAGADDYLGKPFDPIVFGPFIFVLGKRELKRHGETVRLTERERDILVRFARQPGETIARHALVDDAKEIGERTIDVQINRLRRKIESDPANPRYLQTVRGIGYRLSIE